MNKQRKHAKMSNNKSWAFLSVVYFFLCAPVVASVNAYFQENIALNKNVTQSSDQEYPMDGDVWSAGNAVDGNKNCTHIDKDHYSGTANEVVSWWQVDLGNIYSLSKIIVYGRPQETPVQLKGFQVYLLTSENNKDKRHIYNNTDYDNGVFTIPVKQHLFGRYVRIEMTGNYRKDTTGPLVLCEVEVYPTDIIQELKTTVTPSMSSKSTYMENSIHWDESRAIDGVNNFSPDSCSCCSGTNGKDIPWWRLWLPSPYIIAQVMIYGRSDWQNIQQSSDLCVYGSNSTTDNGTQLYHGNPNRDSYVYSISLQPPRLFQSLTVRRWITGLMTICEVKMFQAGCPSGSFGDKCLGRCNCRNGVACDVNTGHCDSCPPGFIGDSCQTRCPHSMYGYNCNETCDTCTQRKCRNTDGFCSVGCVPGYKPNDPYCKEECDDGQYGQNCSESCSGHCKHGNQECNKKNGNCIQGCVDGYLGERCEKACAPSRYGKECSQICSTCEGMSCKNTDGVCYNGYVPGYKPADQYCREECSASTYGKNCSHICRTCEGMSCNNTDGFCYNGCVPGYQPEDPYCRKACNASTYGKNCTLTCSNCEGSFCNNTDGLCVNGCVPGYKFEDPYCNTTCPASTYGRNCSQTCITCESMACKYTDGSCFSGCVPGYKFDDLYCKTYCTGGTFGRNCNSTCHCANNDVCSKINGTCADNRCAPKWKGLSCQVFQDNNILHSLRYKIKTSMSTVAGNWTSDRAVDGNTGPDPNTCQCCSGTTNAPLSWWMVDLGELFPLNGIAIYSRNNENDIRQLQGFQVILSAQTTYNASSFKNESLGMFSKMYVIILKDTLARYIKIQRPGVLTLCEVKLFQGVCRVGTFGRECARGCHCADNKPCNQLSGYCQSSACKTGWQGPSCNETCPPETFGDNCSDNCYCAEGTCTNNYGICPGKCRQGYHGAHCNKVGSDVKGESEIKENTALIIGSAGASGTLLVIAIIVGVVILKFRKRKRDSVKNEYETPNRRASPTEIPEYDTIDNVITNSTHPVGPNYTTETDTGL